MLRATLVIFAMSLWTQNGLAQPTGVTAKQKVTACVAEKLAKARKSDTFSVEGGVTCRKGVIKNASCSKQNLANTVSYKPPDGWAIKSASGDSTSKTDRGHTGQFTWDQRQASMPVSCNGNGCDKGEREWSKVRLSGTIERSPTEEERKNAMDQCLDELLK